MRVRHHENDGAILAALGFVNRHGVRRYQVSELAFGVRNFLEISAEAHDGGASFGVDSLNHAQVAVKYFFVVIVALLQHAVALAKRNVAGKSTDGDLLLALTARIERRLEPAVERSSARDAAAHWR